MRAGQEQVAAAWCGGEQGKEVAPLLCRRSVCGIVFHGIASVVGKNLCIALGIEQGDGKTLSRKPRHRSTEKLAVCHVGTFLTSLVNLYQFAFTEVRYEVVVGWRQAEMQGSDAPQLILFCFR